MPARFDIAYLATLPNFVVMAAADEAELTHMVATAAAIDDRPSAIRYPRGEGTGIARPAEGVALPIGKGRMIREGSGIAILSLRHPPGRSDAGGGEAVRPTDLSPPSPMRASPSRWTPI